MVDGGLLHMQTEAGLWQGLGGCCDGPEDLIDGTHGGRLCIVGFQNENGQGGHSTR